MRKKRKIFGGRPLQKRPYSEISKGSKRIADISTPERKKRKRKICQGTKRSYGEIDIDSSNLSFYLSVFSSTVGLKLFQP